jgi:ankyrin repeat protein
LEAVNSGNHELIEYLIEKGSNINHQDIYGNSALIKAVIKGNDSAVIKLLEKGADPNLIDSNGHTALTWSRASGFTKLEEIIKTKIDNEDLFIRKYINGEVIEDEKTEPEIKEEGMEIKPEVEDLESKDPLGGTPE